MKKNLNIVLILALAAFGAGGCIETPAPAAEKQPDINFEGYWKFSIGDDSDWANPIFSDSSWEEIFVPSPWEDEGFHGYDGYAWYRKHFTVSEKYENSPLYLDLGFIDDVDETYLNGHLIGASGSFPPNYVTAYSAQRKYPLPPDYINYNGDNIISVRVYDAQLGGGIMSGNIGLFITKDMVLPEQFFNGKWKFATGDKPVRKEINYDDKGWNEIRVPGFWETQGYRNYDGFAWYRKSFVVDENLKNKKLILLLGKIDDYDQVFINGELIGSTGKWFVDKPITPLDDYYRKDRVYYIPDGIINQNGKNLIAVRVYDGFVDGGIYEGNIGLITQTKYNRLYK